MSAVVLPPVSLDAGLVERVAAALRHDGYAEVEHALPEVVIDALLAGMADRNGFEPAGIGRDDDHRRRPAVRGDLIAWLDGGDDATRWYLDWAELLRLELNRRLILGLFEYECHFAWYPVGARYATHVDAFRGQSNRVVSTVLYLNPAWEPTDGGELVLYAPVDAGPVDGEAGPPGEPALVVEQIVLPRHGTMVLFLSEEFPPEVLAAERPRRSITGWFRLNASSSGRIDPPPA